MQNKKFIYFLSIILFLLSFYIYLKNLCPSVYFGDSGELISAAFVLGIPHPTGFPLYILIAKLFSFLNLGDVAFRINLLSAFFSSLTIVLIFFSFFLLNKNSLNLLEIIFNFSFSLIFIFTYTFWSQSTIARVYTLNAFFCALFLLLFLFYNEFKNSQKILLLLSFLTGLGSGLHLTFVLFAIILWIYLFTNNFTYIRKNILYIIFFIFLGISIYIYLVIRGNSNTLLNWHPIKSFQDFVFYITQKQYSQKMFARDISGYTSFLNYIFFVLLREFTIWGFILFIFGVLISFLKNFKYTIPFIAIYISNLLLLAFYGNYTDLKLAFRYFIPSHLITLIFIYLLFYYLCQFLKNNFLIKIFSVLLSLLISFSLFNKNYLNNDKSNDFIPYFYPQDILSSCEKKSYLFITGDNQIFTIAYFKYVKNRFNEITIFDTSDTVFKDINILQKESNSTNLISNILAALKLKLSPLYTAVPTKAHSYFEPVSGFINKITEQKSDDDYSHWKKYSLKGILHDPISYDFEEREVVGTYLYRYANYFKHIKNDKIHIYLLEKAVKVAYDSVPVLGNVAIIYSEKNNNLERAEELLKKALALNPLNESLLFNMGSLHASKNEFKLAIDYFSKVVNLNPLNFNAKIYLERAKKEYENRLLLYQKLDIKDEKFDEGVNLLNQKKINAALSLFKELLKKYPDSPKLNFHIGLCYSILNQFNDAIPYYQKVLDVQPENISALNNLGLIYLNLNEKHLALRYFRKSLEIDNNQPQILNIIKKIDLK